MKKMVMVILGTLLLLGSTSFALSPTELTAYAILHGKTMDMGDGSHATYLQHIVDNGNIVTKMYATVWCTEGSKGIYPYRLDLIREIWVYHDNYVTIYQSILMDWGMDGEIETSIEGIILEGKKGTIYECTHVSMDKDKEGKEYRFALFIWGDIMLESTNEEDRSVEGENDGG